MKKVIVLVFFSLFVVVFYFEYKWLMIKFWFVIYFVDDVEYFKYGLIGVEVDGFFYVIWCELLVLFVDELFGGFVDFGFLSELGKDLLIGVFVCCIGVFWVGFNCGICYVFIYCINGWE